MLLNDAVELVDNLVPAFYSRLFLVKKVMGSWRPVIDLFPLNQFVVLKFRMEMAVSVLALVRKGDFMFSELDRDFCIPLILACWDSFTGGCGRGC